MMSGENSSARELENTVVAPVRRQLLQVSGLREIKSETRDGAGMKAYLLAQVYLNQETLQREQMLS